MHADGGKPPCRIVGAHAALPRIREEARQRRGQRRSALAADVARAADVVAVLGDVGEQREVAERPDHHHRLVGRKPIQDAR